MRYAHFAEMCERCGTKRNMRQSHIPIKLACLIIRAVLFLVLRLYPSRSLSDRQNSSVFATKAVFLQPLRPNIHHEAPSLDTSACEIDPLMHLPALPRDAI